jgi:hypothetical protein
MRSQDARRTICPPSRRGHAWRELSQDAPRPAEVSPIFHPAEARLCARCGALGRVNKQGVVVVVTTPEEVRTS